jgi:predicted RNA-binding protein YlxR (DUF448 family)
MCVGCRERKAKEEFIRLVRSPVEKDNNGAAAEKFEISFDSTYKKPGRGAYICKNPLCLKRARKSKSFERVFKTNISDDIYKKLEEGFTSNE